MNTGGQSQIVNLLILSVSKARERSVIGVVICQSMKHGNLSLTRLRIAREPSIDALGIPIST